MQKALMKGFPPPTELQVTLANWRRPPFNKWSFQHVREIIPTADIPNDPDNVRKLSSTAQGTFTDLSIKVRRQCLQSRSVPAHDRYRCACDNARWQDHL